MSEVENIREVLNLALKSTTEIVSKVLLSMIVGALMILLSIIIVKITSRLLKISKIDDILAPFFKKYNIPFTVSSIVKSILILGLSLLVLYSSVVPGFPGYKSYVVKTIDIIARVASVFYMILLVYTAVNYVTEKLKMERGLGGYMVLVIFNITLILLIDVTALSPVVKEALSWGLSLGLGLSVAVFTAWYFFGSESPYRLVKRSKTEKEDQE